MILSSRTKLVIALSGMVYGSHKAIWKEIQKLTKDFSIVVYIDTWDVDWNINALNQMLDEYREGDYTFDINYKIYSYTGHEYQNAYNTFLQGFKVTRTNSDGPVLLRTLSSLLIHKFSFDRIYRDLGSNVLVFRTRPAYEFRTSKFLSFNLSNCINMISNYGGFNKLKLKSKKEKQFFISDAVSFSSVNDSQFVTYSNTGKELFSNVIEESIEIFKENNVPNCNDTLSLEENIGPESKFVDFSKGWMLYELLERHKIVFASDSWTVINSIGIHSYKVRWPSLFVKKGKLTTDVKEKDKSPVVVNDNSIPLYTGYLLV